MPESSCQNLSDAQGGLVVSDQNTHKPDLLLLCHRIPYPPNKGDKIRAWHLLKHLATRYSIHLGTFVDDPADWIHVPFLRRVCKEVMAVPLNPSAAKLQSLAGLLRGEALSVPYYTNRALSQWIASLAESAAIEKCVVFSSVMGQFLPTARGATTTVVDFVDVDSDKWRQYAQTRSWPLSWLYKREASRLEQYERHLSATTDASLFVSEPEVQFFCRLPGIDQSRCGFYANGVDTEFFDPATVQSGPAAGSPELVFTGAMDYWPNIDAVCWFVEEVMPGLTAKFPGIRLVIVGGKPARAVQRLRRMPGVEVTGRVADVRPFLARAHAVVAPMRIARGVQNKVLEAMAMARPVLVTQTGLEGIAAKDGETVLVANTADAYLRKLSALLAGDYPDMGPSARNLVLEHFSWSSCLTPVFSALAQNHRRAPANEVILP